MATAAAAGDASSSLDRTTTRRRCHPQQQQQQQGGGGGPSRTSHVNNNNNNNPSPSSSDPPSPSFYPTLPEWTPTSADDAELLRRFHQEPPTTPYQVTINGVAFWNCPNTMALDGGFPIINHLRNNMPSNDVCIMCVPESILFKP